MYDTNSTIIALSTPAGYGAIGVIRLSGNHSKEIVQPLLVDKFSFEHKKVKFAKIFDNQEHIDDVLITYFASPHSYTGEDIIEISCHGSPYIAEKIIDLCLQNGAVLAEPGQFTKRAFLNDKMDLSQAEGVDAMIHAKTKHAHETAKNLLDGKLGYKIKEIKQSIIDTITLLELELDFSDQELDFTPHSEILTKIQNINKEIQNLLQSYHYGKLIKDGINTALIGSPNSGKSSLMNAFLQEERVIVSEIPGTTRDSIEESIRRGGYQFRLIDTAGIRKSVDKVEKLGIERSIKAIEEADLKLLLIDPSNNYHLEFEQYLDDNTIIVINKLDISDKESINSIQNNYRNHPQVTISAKHYKNIHDLTNLMVTIIKNKEPKNSDLFITIKRHFNSLENISKELLNTIFSIQNGNPSEIIVTDMRFALSHLDTILGKTTDDDILNNIFANFCIGK